MSLITVDYGEVGGGQSISFLKQGSELSTSDFVEITTLESTPKYIVLYVYMSNYNYYCNIYYWDIENDTFYQTWGASGTGGFESDKSSSRSGILKIEDNKLKYKCANQYFVNNTRFIISY